MITIENSISGIQKEIVEVITSNIDEIFSGELSLDLDFADIGLDSLTYIKLVINLESEFDFEFDDDMLLITAFSKLKTMVEYVESKIAYKEKNI